MDRVRSSAALYWIAAVIGFPIGGYLGHALAGPAATVPAALLSGLIAGAIIGLAQALTLGLRSQVLVTWVVGTGLSLAAALAVVTAAIGQIETSTEAMGLGAVSGALIGAAQAFVFMRAGVARAWIWIPVTALAWTVGWFITAGIGVALAPGWPVFGLSGAIVAQVITAVAISQLIVSREALRAGA